MADAPMLLAMRKPAQVVERAICVNALLLTDFRAIKVLSVKIRKEGAAHLHASVYSHLFGTPHHIADVFDILHYLLVRVHPWHLQGHSCH